MPKALLKKVLISLLLACYLLVLSLANVSLVSRVSAQTPAPNWYDQNPVDWYEKVYTSPSNDVFGERYTAAQVQWIIFGLFSNLVVNPIPILAPKDKVCLMRFKPLAQCVAQGVLDRIKDFFKISSSDLSPKNPLAYIFFEDRPLSGITYFRNVGRNWHIIPEARAQGGPGFGFGALNPILPLWKASRNAAYGVLVLAILILSFMIMFRVKINPQTVISVQSAIPKVVFALILITFSYAIAGFMVDLMYVAIGLISLLFSSSFGGGKASDIFNLMVLGYQNGGVLTTLTMYFSLLLLALFVGVFGTFGAIITAVGIAAGIITAVISGPIGWLILIAIFTILLITVILIIIKVLWMLLKAFAFVVILTIFAPLQIALGVVIPSLGFGQWIRSLASNLAVFVLTGTFIVLGLWFQSIGVLMVLGNVLPGGAGSYKFLFGLFASSIPGSNVASQGGWPPLLGIGGVSAQGTILILVSMVILLILPKVSDMIQAIIEGKPFAYGAAIGEAVGPVTTIGLGGLGYASAREQAGYLEREKAGTLTDWDKRWHGIFSAMRAASGGRLK